MLPTVPAVTIDLALDRFLAVQRARLADTTYRRYVDVVTLLRDSLNGYGYQSLSEAEERRGRATYDAGRQDAFCALFGPEKIIDELGGFLGWFMVRKVLAGEGSAAERGTR